MHRTKIVVVSLTGLALLAAAAGSVAASSANAPWRIFLTSNREGDSEMYSMNAEGSGVRRLTRTPGWDGFGSLSPDGNKLLYGSQDRRVGNPEIYVMNPDGTGKRRLTRNPAFDCCPAWSPDGRKILFTSNRDGNDEVYVMKADGSGQRSLSPSPSTKEFSGFWSPDGGRSSSGAIATATGRSTQ
jgi:TolB protein